MRDAAIKRLSDIAVQNPKVMLVTGDLGFGVLTTFAQNFPRQYINAGVAEQNMTAMACGLALEGRCVFTYSIANFPTLRCLEQIRNDVCYHDANVKIIAIGGGFSYGQLGMSHHATEDIAILRALPNITVVVPSDEWSAAGAIAALASTPGPAYLRLDKSSSRVGERAGETFVLGKIRQLRDGDDIALFATGGIVGEALQAADLLAAQGIGATVIDVHTIKPLDKDGIVAVARRTRAVVTIEEHNVIGGLGGAVAETLLEAGVSGISFRRIGLQDQYSSVVGDQGYLRRVYHLDAPAIVASVIDLLSHNSKP